MLRNALHLPLLRQVGTGVAHIKQKQIQLGTLEVLVCHKT